MAGWPAGRNPPPPPPPLAGAAPCEVVRGASRQVTGIELDIVHLVMNTHVARCTHVAHTLQGPSHTRWTCSRLTSWDVHEHTKYYFEAIPREHVPCSRQTQQVAHDPKPLIRLWPHVHCDHGVLCHHTKEKYVSNKHKNMLIDEPQPHHMKTCPLSTSHHDLTSKVQIAMLVTIHGCAITIKPNA